MLDRALTHRSRANEDATGSTIDNESLEFLGDAVLGFVMADLLFRDFPQFDEGQKSKIKASLVSTATLAQLGRRLGLGEFLALGRGEEKTGGRSKHALLADSCEAVIAAIYLDGGIDEARAFIVREFADRSRGRPEPGVLGPRLQVGAPGAGAVARPAAARVLRRRRERPGPSQDLPRRGARARRGGGRPRAGRARRPPSRRPRTRRWTGCRRAG